MSDDPTRSRPGFLVLSGDALDIGPMPYRTAMADGEGILRGAEVRIIEITKKPNNPFRDRISLGRALNCDIVIRNTSVSKLHAHFLVSADYLELLDLESHNGTLVNGHRLTSNVAVKVKSGSRVQFGRVVGLVVSADEIATILGKPQKRI